MRLLLSAVAFFLMGATPAITETTKELKTEPVEVSASLTKIEKSVRDSSVKVLTGNGHGSGGLIRYKDMQLILTAQHVTNGSLGSVYLTKTLYEDQLAVLIYADPLHDMAVLYVPNKFVHTKGIKWNPSDNLTEVGTEITYSGFPSWHNLMTFRGYVAGYETDPQAGVQMLLNTYGWFGCSGSLIYNQAGEMIGILWGVDLQRGAVQENMIWVAPIQNLDIKLALKTLCDGLGDKPKACR
jgi:S1-C subfamily serine protease